MSGVMNFTAIFAVVRRELSNLLGNPLGYVFIFAFVVATAIVMFFVGGNSYFARMVADLRPLYDTMPMLLAVLLPAIGMGSWARERELGTEELLMTMPLSTLDVVIGKWLAIVAFFTLALLCTLSNPIAVSIIGSPDWGAIVANYIGWWLAGAAAAALSLLASVMVSQSAVAFVVGALLCGLVMMHSLIVTVSRWVLELITFGGVPMPSTPPASWFDAFNRGVIPAGHVVGALAVIVAALGIAVAILASRRWREADYSRAWGQVASLVLAVAIAINVAGIANRYGTDADATADGLSSLSAGSKAIVAELKVPVTIHAFISNDDVLPVDLKPKAQELTDMLAAIARSSNGQIEVQIYRPTDAFTGDGKRAKEEFAIEANKVMADRVAGRQPTEVFLGAAVSCGPRTEVIKYFEPGMAAEYELMVAIRGVSQVKKPVLGVAITDAGLLGDMTPGNPTMGMPPQSTPEWEVVREWRRLYDIRNVDLKSPVDSTLKALVVAQPSTLTQQEIVNLHTYIWNGGKTLLLEDPIPLFTGPARFDLVPGEPKRNPNANPMMGMPPEGGPAKGDLKPLMAALGLDWRPEEALWSQYLPSYEYQHILKELPFVWARRDDAPTAPVLTGVRDLLTVLPGELRLSPNAPKDMVLTPLITVTPRVDWGRAPTAEVLQRDDMRGGGLQYNRDFKRLPSGELVTDFKKLPAIAVELTGTMPAAYSMSRPAVVAASAAGVASATAGAVASPALEITAGTSSPKPVQVFVVADLDWITDQFFSIYRNTGGSMNRDDTRFLQQLRNVQFSGHLVDMLMGDTALLQTRARRPERRSLVTIDRAFTEKAKLERAANDKAQRSFDNDMEKYEAAINKEVEQLQKREDLDPAVKANAIQDALGRTRVQITAKREKLMQDRDDAVRKATAESDRSVFTIILRIKFWAVFIPASVLALIAIAVFVGRRQAERMSIPVARTRAAKT